jgi:hypothetical protein
MRGVMVMISSVALALVAGCASTSVAQKYDGVQLAGECKLKAVTHPEPGTGPVQVTRDDGEHDHDHYLVADFEVTYSQTNSYGGASSYTNVETIALAPEQEFAAFSKSGALSASPAGSCTKHSPLVTATRVVNATEPN